MLVARDSLLVPALLRLYPYASPYSIASIALAGHFLKAISGSFTDRYIHRIDHR
jgi:hypothetical protein